MERIFNNGAGNQVAINGVADLTEEEDFSSAIRAMIVDAVDFNESTLMPDREEAWQYYYGLQPALTGEIRDYDSLDTAPEEGDAPSRSSIVSTDVRDTIMAILPSLMRIFASSEHVVNYIANTAESVEQAKQATDYIRQKFWDECGGFLILHGAFKDALVSKIGIIAWDTEVKHDVQEKDFGDVTYEEIVGLLGEDENNQLVDYTEQRPDGTFERVTLRYIKTNPQLTVWGVAPDEFRVSRNAKDILNADLVGQDTIVRASDLVKAGYDADEVYEYVGASYSYYEERYMRNAGEATFAAPLNDLVRYGEYFIRIDADGDGIAELHKICTIGDNYDILDDKIVNHVKYAVFGPDPKPHTLVGDSFTDLTKDVQKINTNLIRGALDSLAQVINPRTGINETLVNVEDALNDDIGAIIRSRGNPNETMTFYQMPWVGADVFQMKDQIDRLRIARTGVSEASKGLDPKALQSTAVMGVDMIANGAQERIELIARIFAETGLKDMYKGLLQEVSDWPNKEEIVELRGKFVPVNPSTFDASMRVRVNPALGRGSDMTRLSALADVKATQEMILSKFGLKNNVVGVQEYRNTLVDMLDLVNIRDVTRYFKEITPELEQQIQMTPDEPAPEMVLAKAEMEKVKAGVVEKKAELTQKSIQADKEDDFRRDELNVNAFLELVGILADYQTAMVPDEAVSEAQSLNQPG